ncbi:ADL388Wp [Eremothecium gossypii ATCC 10895]|uniref:Transcription factor n=1 Tax=Eremothecium gossypii (strain ATCC 10895 / CBS 109.51 / FGSC 9923 / NRRL Y-1056) TaxID=284811 RepID=Q75BF2_EREGS|nr:ADL388Wp [Eremothecium gossypii ATCC 10895]AAS51532.1 ADL388Wp [Eremothecium gossypii ATCC 10895]AEY95828.1 FADL388Wp [Eremothecium gossypii FDAG1]
MAEEIQMMGGMEVGKKLPAAQKGCVPRGNGSRAAYNDFVRKLFAILESGEYTDIISWTKEGNSFVVVDTNEFTTNILPKHFKHSNFSSFVRQLNKYDFHKVKRTPEERQSSVYGEHSWEFQHPRFRRNDEAALDRIKRKTVTQKKVSLTDDMLAGHQRVGNGAVAFPAMDLGATTNLLLNNTINKTKFSQLKKRVDSIELHNQQLRAENNSLKIEFQKMSSRYNSMVENLVSLKNYNNSLVENFNLLVSTLAQQGLKVPHPLNLGNYASSQVAKNSSASDVQPHVSPLGTVAPTSIPLAQATPSKEEANPPTSLRPGFHVLLVEDDSVCIQLCSKFLRKYGCSVEVVTDGLSAIETVEKFQYDLVLMDIVMPNLDGATATSVIRSFDNQTPIIAMTGNIEDQDLVTYLQHGMNDILAKPFTKDDLHSMLVRYLKDRIPLTEQASVVGTAQSGAQPPLLKEEQGGIQDQVLLQGEPLLKKPRV